MKIAMVQRHYLDLFIIETLAVIHWFNPVVWFYERSLKETHEYLADEAVLSTGENAGKYKAILVNQAMGGPVFVFTNQFNQSLIKKRIIMMNKIKSPRWAKLKALLFVPLMAAILVAFANPKTDARRFPRETDCRKWSGN
jgi:beta-lactamase regulating signal transducer with metallopeptidase domain